MEGTGHGIFGDTEVWTEASGVEEWGVEGGGGGGGGGREKGC